MDRVCMNAMDWGWNHQDNLFVPIMSTMNATPDILLKVIHCNCLNFCKTLRRSCRRNRLPCTSACGSCQITKCNSPHNQILLKEHGDDDDEILIECTSCVTVNLLAIEFVCK